MNKQTCKDCGGRYSCLEIHLKSKRHKKCPQKINCKCGGKYLDLSEHIHQLSKKHVHFMKYGAMTEEEKQNAKKEYFRSYQRINAAFAWHCKTYFSPTKCRAIVKEWDASHGNFFNLW